MRVKHGMYGATEYNAWASIKARCYNPKNSGYCRYGGRGIKMYGPWIKDFQAFFDYIGRKPTPEHSLDRIDNNRGYEPGNIRWATKKEQCRNRRDNYLITICCQTKPLSEWAEIYGLPADTVTRRLRVGYSVKDAFFIGNSSFFNF